MRIRLRSGLPCRLALLANFLLAAGAARAQETTSIAELPEGPIRIEAENLEVRKGRIVEATGGAVVSGPGLKIRAERVAYDRLAGQVELDGGVVVEVRASGEDARLTATSGTFDLRTRAGVLRDAELTGAGMTLKGERIARTESGTYRIEEARFSPCACETGRPSWEITATRVSVRPSGIAILQGGVLRARGVPVFFLPIGVAPYSSSRASGFLSPQFRPGGTDGLVASVPFYVAVSPRWDLTVEPGLNAVRGPFVGATARGASDGGRGELSVVYHADRKIKDQAAVLPGDPSDYPTDRWYANARSQHALARNWVGKARIELAGDDRYAFDFGQSLMERSRSEYENNVFAERRDGILGVVLGSSYYQDLRILGSGGVTGNAPYNSAQTVSRMGWVDASASGLPLLGNAGLGAYADVEGQYELFNNISSPQGSFRRGGELGGAPRRQVQHAQFRPAIVTPLSLLGDGVRMSTIVAARGDLSADPLGADSRARLAPELGGDLRAEWRRTFGTTTRVQHRVGPVARWRWTPSILGDELTSFEDPRFRPVEGHRVEVGISNRILYRRRTAEFAPVRELIEVMLLERFRPDGPEDGETVLNLDLRTGPLRLDLDAGMDNATGRVSSAGGRAATRADAPEGISLEYAYDPSQLSHQGTGGGWLKLAELVRGEGRFARAMRTLTFETGARYDFQARDFLSVTAGLAYESPCGCWGVRFGAAQETDRRYIRVGGWRSPITDVFFSIDLHPPRSLRRFVQAPGGR